MNAPFRAVWTGEAWVPEDRFVKAIRAEFGEGEVVPLVRHEDRSGASHNHYFATLNDLWESLPEEEAERFPTGEHLRKYALIRTGWRDERSIVCASRAEALRLAAFVRPMDLYAVVAVSEAVVRVWTAKSQSLKAMGKADFQRSKDDVLGFVSQMIGVPA